MKRPRWLGGGRARQPDDPDQRADDPGDRPQKAAGHRPGQLAGRQQRGEAASGSSRATRRRLADRVGKAAGEGAGAKPAGTEPGKPALAAGPDEPRGEREGPEGERGPRRAKPEPAEKLNRPRRQPGMERDDRSPAEAGSAGAERGRRRAAEPEGRMRRAGTERERRRSGKRPGARAKAGAAAFAKALKQGAAETRKLTAEHAPKAGRRLLTGLAAGFALFFAVLGFVLSLVIVAGRVLARPVRAVLGVLDRAARAASRALTPARALAIVVAAAAILLALSQYADYRSLSIGNDAYSGVQSVAPAPETGRAQTGDAHSYVFVPVAIACLLLLAVATVGRRWRACRLITLAGAAAVLVALIVDRPAGLDPGDAAVAFGGVRATLIGGFYAEIAAGILLIGSSTLLARELRLATAPERSAVRKRAGESAPKRARRRRRARPGTGPEGTARA